MEEELLEVVNENGDIIRIFAALGNTRRYFITSQGGTCSCL